MPPTPPNARCQNCNYPLHSLPTNTCPECGHPFNPTDPATMNLGKTPGPIAKKLLTHTGLPTLLLALAATITLFIISGPPRIVAPKLTDTLYYLNRFHWRNYAYPSSENLLVAAILLWIGLLAFYMLRVAMRLLAQRIYKLPSAKAPRRILRRVVFTLALLFSTTIILYAWPLRVARSWIAFSGTQFGSIQLYPDRSRYPCPLDLPESDQVTALRIAVASLTSPKDRNAALNLYIAHFPDALPADLTTIASRSGDADFRATCIHILSLNHRQESAPLFQSLLSNPDPKIRAAAADAIDILRGPGVSNPYYSAWTGPAITLDTTPPIDVQQLLSAQVQDANYQWKATSQPTIPFDPSVRATLEHQMTTAPTAEEREAAARALVNWPPPAYQLRAAEWGVWIANPSGDLKLVQSVIDEIPPFVHRIGNTYKSLDDRYMMWFGDVDKPIIHFTTDRALALDVQVMIKQGRPWFAYPKPDDLALSRLDRNSGIALSAELTKMDKQSFPAIDDFREGYPWLLPHHRLHLSDSNRGWFSGPNLTNATSLGLRWQSLIVLPTQASWMSPPAVPNDPKFKWWTDLRNVPSAYLASRGESERFLYYDGPTVARPPRVAKLNTNQLTFEVPERNLYSATDTERPESPTPLRQPLSPAVSQREAFFIHVADGQPHAIRFTLKDTSDSFTKTLPDTLPIEESQAIPEFKKLLTDYGLTPEESQGLINAWKTQLFQKSGQRLLLRLSAADYDTLCPISIKPPPTTLVRLGFVLTEFP